jgi:large subunit ribosomal protein L20
MRVKGGTVARKRRKKILKLAKGYFGSKSTIYRTAHEQVMRSLRYAYRDRKQKKRHFRKLWIQRINAAAKLNGLKYSKLIHGLALANVNVNRKMLADIAVLQPEDFTAFCKIALDAIANKPAAVAKPAPYKLVMKVEPKVEPKVEVKAVKPEVKEVKAVKAEVKPEVKAVKAEVKPVQKVEAKVETVDYSKLLVKDLKALAVEKGIANSDKMLKADLVAALSSLK